MNSVKTLLVGLLWCVISSASAQYFILVEDIPPSMSSSDSRGVIFIDLNGDSYPDLYIVNGPENGQNNELYLNDGNGNFIENTIQEITKDLSATVGASFADADNDGDLDGYLANWYDESNLYYENSETGFHRVNLAGLGSRGHSESAAWGDYNNDGFLDLVIANSSFFSGEKNVLVQSQEDGSYQQVTSEVTEAVVNSRSVNWIDVDGDNDLDLFVGNEQLENELYLNQDGVLIRDSINTLFNILNPTFGSSWDDVDNDGDFDLFLANFGQQNWIYINDGSGIFFSTSVGNGTKNSIGSTFGDIDNDGDLDLFVTVGFADQSEDNANELLINDGTGVFTSVTDDPTVLTPISSYGTALADYNNDGFLDLFVANTDLAPNLLFRNNGNNNNWLKIKCNGSLSNYSSIGAIVRIKSKINGEQIWQTRHISTQTGYTSQNSLQVHFGLAQASTVDSLVIIWPSGNTLVRTDLEVNQLIEFTEPVLQGQFRPNFVVTKVEFTNEKFLVSIKNLTAFNEEDQLDYAWDFDNDGAADSEEFEPEIQFSEEGSFTIRLIVTDGETTKESFRSFEIDKGVVLGVNKNLGITIFPNPTDTSIDIISASEVYLISIYNLDGKEVLKVRRPKKRIQIGGLRAGIYILNIHTRQGVHRERIVINR